MKGILLVNLGSPKALDLKSVRSYLREFLSDDLVIDLPKPLQQILVNLIIVPFRSKGTLQAYSEVWTEQGSPLLTNTYAMAEALTQHTRQPVAVAMRYQTPSIKQGISELIDKGCDAVHVLPLYPHYAMSTTLTTVRAAEQAVKELNADIALTFTERFYADKGYIQSLAGTIKRGLPENNDYLLFSYHGLPIRHLTKTDPTGAHCTKVENCCATASEATPYCYKAQVLETSRLCARELGLADDAWGVTFQSRIGPGWLQPFTDEAMKTLPAEGKTHLAVVCPSFVADCLETIEEVNLRARADFLEAGGESFTYIPCLNHDPEWVEFLSQLLVTEDDRIIAAG